MDHLTKEPLTKEDRIAKDLTRFQREWKSERETQ